MTDNSGRDAARVRRKRWFAAAAAVVVLAMVVPLSAALLQRSFVSPDAVPDNSSATAAPTPEPPKIAPLTVRSVVSAVVTTPEDCPQPTAGPPTGDLQMCDIPKTALYTLGAETVQLQLTQAESLLSPITNAYFVQVSMTPESAQTFGDFTAANLGKQVAFIRGDVVVSAPSISQRVDGEVLQLSGDMSAELAEQVARMLRDQA